MCLTPKTTEKGSMELERLPVTLFYLRQSPNFLGCILLSHIISFFVRVSELQGTVF